MVGIGTGSSKGKAFSVTLLEDNTVVEARDRVIFGVWVSGYLVDSRVLVGPGYLGIGFDLDGSGVKASGGDIYLGGLELGGR